MAKKESWTWMATKATFIGIGMGIAAIYNFTSKHARKGIENRKLNKSMQYNSPSVFEELKVIRSIAGDYRKFESALYENSLIILIFGRRGSGKSVLGFKLLENIYNKTNRKCYALGINQMLMPKWISSIEDVDNAANNSIILVDEGALSFNSRESMKSKNRDIGKLLAIARHKNLTLIFITQNTGLIDRNVLKLTDILLIKEGSLLQMEMERSEIKKFYEKSNKALSELDEKKEQYVYVIDSNFEGVLSHPLPSFWSSDLSKNKSK